MIYDEVHLLPAPVFRMTADLQSRRRLGLTATLVREDGREGDVFSLIGPKRYDAPWKDIESQGWIAPAECTEVRVTLTDAERLSYATAEPEERYKIASTARTKMPVVRSILDRHPGEPTLVIGAYLEQLEELGEELQAPIIQGSTTQRRAGAAVRRVPGRRGLGAGGVQGGELLHRPAGGHGGRSRCPAPSAPGRRRRSGSAGCCGPRTTGGRRTSTPWCRGTPWTPTTPPTGSGSWPSRATRTGSSTPTTCSGRPFPDRPSDPPPVTSAAGTGRPQCRLRAGRPAGRDRLHVRHRRPVHRGPPVAVGRRLNGIHRVTRAARADRDSRGGLGGSGVVVPVTTTGTTEAGTTVTGTTVTTRTTASTRVSLVPQTPDGLVTGPGVDDTAITLGAIIDPDTDRGFLAGFRLWQSGVNATTGVCGRTVALRFPPAATTPTLTAYQGLAPLTLGLITLPSGADDGGLAEQIAADQVPAVTPSGQSTDLSSYGPMIVGATDDILAINAASYLAESGIAPTGTTLSVGA